jgi:hypothetical protein
MINLERELGPHRFAIAIEPARDPFETNRTKAIVLPNGCRVYRWDRIFDDTGKQLFYAQVWLPAATKPILNVRKGYESNAMREKEIEQTLAAYDGRNSVEQLEVANADTVLDAPTFDPAQFTLEPESNGRSRGMRR